jgi:competence protein ComEA
MDDVPIPPGGLTARLEALGVRRREALAVAAVVAGVVLVALLLLARSAPAVIAPPSTGAPVTGTPVTGPSMPSGSTPGASIFVHVAGFVRSPGLYGLSAGARVADAIDAAGGARPVADLDAVNLAQVLTDGLKIEVPRRGSAPAPSASASSPGAGGVVSLNSADQSALEAIPGIGPVKAAAIVQYRTDNGAFSSLDRLLDVSGIGPATLESIRPYVSL